MSHKIPIQTALRFVLGGKAIFTVRSMISGTRFTYKVNCPRDMKPEDATLFFVSVLTGPDNESAYQYIGTIRKVDGYWRFAHGVKSKISQQAPSVVAFTFILNEILSFGRHSNTLEIWHEGKCCRCGRKLTVPSSIESGFGPECINYAK